MNFIEAKFKRIPAQLRDTKSWFEKTLNVSSSQIVRMESSPECFGSGLVEYALGNERLRIVYDGKEDWVVFRRYDSAVNSPYGEEFNWSDIEPHLTGEDRQSEETVRGKLTTLKESLRFISK